MPPHIAPHFACPQSRYILITANTQISQAIQGKVDGAGVAARAAVRAAVMGAAVARVAMAARAGVHSEAGAVSGGEGGDAPARGT